MVLTVTPSFSRVPHHLRLPRRISIDQRKRAERIGRQSSAAMDGAVLLPAALLVPPLARLAQKLGEGRKLTGRLLAGAGAERLKLLRRQTRDPLGFKGDRIGDLQLVDETAKRIC
jgi:hypothetical protein